MILIAGLGNYEKQYKSTRHNIGFIAADYLSNYYQFHFHSEPKFQAELAIGLVDNQKLLITKPATYMNLSGISIKSICSYYKIQPHEVYVIHDDIDLSLGRIKCKLGGSSGGHNGIKSIDGYIGSNYYRIRIGIGRPDPKMEVSDYVLQNFTTTEYKQIISVIALIADNLSLCIAGKFEEFNKSVQLKNKV